MRGTRLTRMLLWTAVLAAAVRGIAFAAGTVQTERQLHHARLAMSAWQQLGTADATALAVVRRSLDAVVADRPRDTEAIALRTRLGEWEAFVNRLSPDIAERSIGATLVDFDRLLSLQPARAASWAGRALAESGRRRPVLARIERDIAEALALGRYDVDTQLRAAEAALRHWQRLGEQTRVSIRSVYHHQLRESRYPRGDRVDRELIRLAVQYGQGRLVLPYLEGWMIPYYRRLT